MRFTLFLRLVPLACVALATACTASTNDTSDEEGSEEALSGRPALSLTRDGLVGTYMSASSYCIRFARLALKTDGTVEAVSCSNADNPDAVPDTGTWTYANQTLSLTVRGVATSDQVTRAPELRYEPSLPVIQLASGTSKLLLAKTMPANSVLANMKVGETRELRYEFGKRAGLWGTSLSAVTFDAPTAGHVVVRVESDRPMQVGYLPFAATANDLPTASPIRASGGPVFQTTGSYHPAVMTVRELVIPTSAGGKYTIVFGSDGESVLNMTGSAGHFTDRGVHVRIALRDQDAPAPMPPAVGAGPWHLIESTYAPAQRTLDRATFGSAVVQPDGKIRLSIQNPPCVKSPSVWMTLSPDGSGGYSGTRSDEPTGGFAYGSVRTVSGRTMLHVELFDNFVYSHSDPSPYVNARTCNVTLDGPVSQ